MQHQSLVRTGSIVKTHCAPVYTRSCPGAADKATCALTAKDQAFTVVVLGASGDLAKKKLFPALAKITHEGLVPPQTLIVGFARTKFTQEEFRAMVRSRVENAVPAEAVDSFVAKVHYVAGDYGSADDFAALDRKARELEQACAKAGAGASSKANRIFYFSLPPSVYLTAATRVKGILSATGWNRLIVEKPFGRDLDSSAALQRDLMALYSEDQIYRIDHYLGKEMVLNLLTLRFANSIYEPLWNKSAIKSVLITFKENIDTEGRGGYFDEFGIIRDVMQNHLIQVLALVAMEAPVSLCAEDIRDEKVKVLRCIAPACVEAAVVGQYEGYAAEPGVPHDTRTPTFALVRLCVQNQRWAGVPFFLKCGKALNERKAEIRIQFRPPVTYLYDNVLQNELVIRIQPDEAVYVTMMNKVPGISDELVSTELELSYQQRFSTKGVPLPDAYEHLIRDVVRGDHSLFVRSDELTAAWKIFTPLLHELETRKTQPIVYRRNTRGPAEADELLQQSGFVYVKKQPQPQPLR
eukprot:TRINITY_DN4026_c0_g1_i2.p1 TRINITY_DN4026_c0_g1~~TRINITY_DN4026_c0_g1_i2.p1  ORF type:complete len:523 (+),score=130.42 TRINITY_DN4026_c0_g1_i2:47-1615(+)